MTKQQAGAGRKAKPTPLSKEALSEARDGARKNATCSTTLGAESDYKERGFAF